MKVVVFTLGCKVNQYESDSLVNALLQKGYEVSTHLECADVYIINTCAVTNEAEKKSRQTIAKCRSLNDKAKIMVCGCASQKDTKQFIDLKNVSFVSGVANKLALVDSLNKTGECVEEHSKEYDDNYISVPTKTRAYIKIQDGCNNFCSYCIIPYLRGRSRSRNIISILNEVDDLSKKVKEIVITGIDISDYKIDDEPSLDVLLEKLEPYTSTVRFRLGSLEQGVMTEEFLQVCKRVNICPHFHLSLQCGCDSELKRMNRKYLTKDYLKTIKLIRKYFPNANISTDIIVGFPEETNSEFNKTYNFAKKVKFANIHIFPYSLRSGTVASRMKQVASDVKKKREQKLQKLNKKLNANYIKASKKENHYVLVEQFENGFSIGHTENYIKCYIPETISENAIVCVKIEQQYKDGVIASLIKER